MGITHLDQLTLNTGPVLPGGGLPIYTGNWYFVNESVGSDGYEGTADRPFATLAYALTKTTANQNDVIAFSGTIHLTATLTWSKNQVHLVGMDAPMQRGKRARISVSGSTAFSPMIDVTASGCQLTNFGTFYGFNSASNNAICLRDTGGRNSYDNVEILGFGDNTVTTGTANRTAARAMLITGSTGEITMRNCVLGGDTLQRGAANYTLEIAGGAPRITLINCDFEADLAVGGTGGSHILIGASGIDRYLNLVNCRFINDTKSSGSAMTQLMHLDAAIGGLILWHNSVAVGVTHIETSPTNQIFLSNAAPSSTADTGIATNNTSA